MNDDDKILDKLQIARNDIKRLEAMHTIVVRSSERNITIIAEGEEYHDSLGFLKIPKSQYLDILEAQMEEASGRIKELKKKLANILNQ